MLTDAASLTIVPNQLQKYLQMPFVQDFLKHFVSFDTVVLLFGVL